MERLQGTPAMVPVWMLTVAAMLSIPMTAGSAVAQETHAEQTFDLIGTVTDEAGQPLVGAFVRLADSDWGSLTDGAGRFRIPKVTRGVLALQAELLGYETLAWKGTVDAGRELPLRMTSKPILLEGLTVVGDRFDSRRRAVAASVRWFDHEALATSPQSTALDFVSTRAGLYRVGCRGSFTSQCFMVRGRVTEPVVWVDENPVFGGLEYLASMAPHELYMVEVYGNGRGIRAYTPQFMERAAETRLNPIPFVLF
ncbi:MAG TPA: carboxypeptidase-like regulatory domain-containing protein [Longimicrobiales bacterium]|nr:carboxypeptidase-like regulatory domain-containing protein [Longimicrobiales bacterium]